MSTHAGSVGLFLAVALVIGGCSRGGDELPPGVTLSAEAEAGRTVVGRAGCAACHSADGSVGVGPSFAGLWGSEVPLDGGGAVVADRTYLDESVRSPAAKRRIDVSGQMPQFGADRVRDAELDQVQAYLEALADVS